MDTLRVELARERHRQKQALLDCEQRLRLAFDHVRANPLLGIKAACCQPLGFIWTEWLGADPCSPGGNKWPTREPSLFPSVFLGPTKGLGSGKCPPPGLEVAAQMDDLFGGGGAA